MANLETLELTINANAESASRGLESLINSLSALYKGVSKAVGGLKQLNSELATLKNTGKISFLGSNGTANATKNIKSNTQAIVENVKAQKELIKATQTGGQKSPGFYNWGNTSIKRYNAQTGAFEKLKPNGVSTLYEESYYTNRPAPLSPEVQAMDEFMERNGIRPEIKGRASEVLSASKNNVTSETTKMLKKQASAIKEVGQNTEKAGKTGKGFFAGLKDLGKDIGKLLPKFTLLNRVMRIASTMLIRMGVRALFNGVKEGFNNFYEYSKATGGEFAKQWDGVYSAWNQMKNQMGAAIAPAISAAIPVINSLANAAITAFNYVSQLIALLSGKKTWTRATEQVSDYSDAINKATGKGGGGGGMKELLAQFDELNVIASESGGGGGGSAAAQTAEEFTDMFEEMTVFDGKIKDLVSWLEDHLPFVHGLIAGIAAALLGLPLSISIGIALVWMGVEESYNAGKDMAKNGVTKDNILAFAKGSLKAALGGALIGFKLGGVPGAFIGLMLGFTISLVALAIGIADGEIEQLYGDLHWEADKIEEEINKLFKFDDVQVEIENLHINHFQLEEAKEELRRQIEEFEEDFSYDVIQFGVNKPETIAKMLADVNSLVDATNNLIKLYKKSIEVGLKVTTQFDNPEDVIKFSNEEWGKIESYVNGLGAEISKILEDGISIDEVATINKLKGQLARITSAIANGRLAGEFVGDIQRGYSGTVWENLDQETLLAYTGQYVQATKDFKDALYTQAFDTQESLGALYYSMLQENADKPGSYTAKELEEAKNNFLQFDVDQDVIDKWKEYGEEGRQIYTRNISQALSSVVARKENWNTTLMNKSKLQGQLKNVRDWVVSNIAANIGYDEKILINSLDLMEFTGWELLGEDVRKRMIYEMQKQFGVGASLYKELKSQLNVPIDDILATNQEAWNKWRTSEKLKFATALVQTYGSEEALAKAKAVGMDIQQTIADGMSEGGKAKEAAEKLMKVIDDETKKHKIEVGANVKATIDVIVNVMANVKNGTVNSVNAIANAAQAVITKNAEGAYDIPRGDLFIANEAGAELVGSIGGKTSVANQGQIIEGISSGVERANAEQNALLRQQNDLLRGILEKEYAVKFGASASFGRTVQQSLNMYDSLVGG